MNRSYCCPRGSSCSDQGCLPRMPSPSLCGPSQGSDCNASYLCSSGPADWSSTGLHAAVVLGDSVSIGWTTQLASMLTGDRAVVHSPSAMLDGGARSTSNFVNCGDMLLSTDRLRPLPLRRGDVFLVNFGLHDYNLGIDGLPEYVAEYREGLHQVQRLCRQAGARMVMLATTPAHNVKVPPSAEATVVALNKAGAGLAEELGVQWVDLHAALLKECGEVPWADSGERACQLCAPQCESLAVHYTTAGYQRIAQLVWAAVNESTSSSRV
eukprot:TRINITY_DN28443_c0_g1_i1.p1 TRINITY_DN28443_c0_g1~~TRINITY_DN28443_c0_g1_i1.p1  ORF type:complete len:268 (+),score=30.74 TRINITY_DN28443_c0_g1_i1:202-1005(+)